MRQLQLTVKATHRVLKLSRTIADLTDSEARGDHPGEPSRGAEVSPQAGFDVDLLIVLLETYLSNPSLDLAPLRLATGVIKIGEKQVDCFNIHHQHAQLLIQQTKLIL